MVTNKKNPASLLMGRHMTKARYKHCFELWRQGGNADRINFLLSREWSMCWHVDQYRNTPDPLLVKHVKHVINLEYSQLDMVA